MKRIVILTALLLLMVAPSWAQRPMEVAVSYGILPMNVSYNHYASRHCLGALTLEGRIGVTERVAVGLVTSYSRTWYDAVGEGRLESHAAKDNLYVVMPTVAVTWREGGWTRLYSGAGVGLACRIQQGERGTFRTCHLSYHLTAVGLEVGHRLYGLAEVGYGYLGVARIGIGYQW